MKFIAEKQVFLKSLGRVKSGVSTKMAPIYSHVKLSLKNNKLQMDTTDSEIEISETIDVEEIEAGEIVAPAAKLFDIIRHLPDGAQIKLEKIGEDSLEITSGRSQYELQTANVSEFPSMSGVDLTNKFTLKVQELQYLLETTKFAMSTDESRYFLNGIYFHKGAKEGVDVFRAVATDGHRLAYCEIPMPDFKDDFLGFIVPSKAINEISKLLEECEEEIIFAFSETRMAISNGKFSFSSRLVNGTFPNYENVIPVQNDKVLKVNKNNLRSALERVRIMVSDRGAGGGVRFNIENNLISLQGESQEFGKGKEQVDSEYSGDNLEIGFNSSYIIDVLKCMDSEEVEFCFSDYMSATIIRESQYSSALYVVMPMRV